FLHAEDGIRARNVTGVQTCALPIFTPSTKFYPTYVGGNIHVKVYSQSKKGIGNKLSLKNEGTEFLNIEKFSPFVCEACAHSIGLKSRTVEAVVAVSLRQGCLGRPRI